MLDVLDFTSQGVGSYSGYHTMSNAWTFPEGLLKHIPAQHYMLVLDNNTSIVHLEVGPQTYLCKDQESAAYGPAKMILIPPGHYAIVQNPVIRSASGGTILDESGQVSLSWGDEEIRFEDAPFPLYPGEVCDKIEPLEILEQNSALRIQATRNLEDQYMKDSEGKPTQRAAGSEWWVFGPATYRPQVGTRIVCRQKPIVIQQGQAIRLRAKKTLVDQTNRKRQTGEEWLHTIPGAYFPGIDEVVVTDVVSPYILTDKLALHVTALHDFTDRFGTFHAAGSNWLVTSEQSESYLLHIEEAFVAKVGITTLTKREYMIITDPIGPDGKLRYGKQEIRRGETSFFLQPGEVAGEKREVEVLMANEALLVQGLVDHPVGKAGEKFLIVGPKEYWPELNIKILNNKQKIKAPIQFGTYCVWRLDKVAGVAAAAFIGLLLFIWFIRRLFF